MRLESLNMLIQQIRELVARQDVRISEHGYDELADDGLLVEEILMGVDAAVIVEEYPDYHKGPCMLVFST